MKKILSVLLVSLSVFVLVSCGSNTKGANTVAPKSGVLNEVRGVTVPKFSLTINEKTITSDDLAEYPTYESKVTSVNSSGTETTVNYIGFKFVDALEKVGLSDMTSYVEAVADDGYSVKYETQSVDNMLIAVSRNGSQFKKNPWFAPCDSNVTGDYVQGLTSILVNNKNEKPVVNMNSNNNANEKTANENVTLDKPEKLDKTDKVTFSNYSFVVGGKEVKNADLEGLKIYKITCSALNSKDAVIKSTYTGYVLKDVLDKLGIDAGKKIIVVANDGYKLELSNDEVNSEYTLVAIEKDKELGKDNTIWIAPCESDKTKKYASNVVEIAVE